MEDRIQAIASRYAAMPEVLAVALGGSRTAGKEDEFSDIDLYVYTRTEVPVEPRRQLAQERGTQVEVNNQYWETGDEWLEKEDGLHVDVLFRSAQFIEGMVDAVLKHQQASVGYSTAFWANVLNCQILFDREGWLAALKERAAQPYPAALAHAIIQNNMPLLRGMIGAYPNQIKRAVQRGDIVAIHHRLTEFLAVYFDVLFALNRLPHPGEKRLLAYAEQLELLPPHFLERVTKLLSFGSSTVDDVPHQVEALVDDIEKLVAQKNKP